MANRIPLWQTAAISAGLIVIGVAYLAFQGRDDGPQPGEIFVAKRVLYGPSSSIYVREFVTLAKAEDWEAIQENMSRGRLIRVQAGDRLLVIEVRCCPAYAVCRIVRDGKDNTVCLLLEDFFGQDDVELATAK